MFRNWVDHNFVWGSTETNGIYVYTSSKVTIANNFVGNCALAGIRVIDIPGRGAIPSGGNTIVNNILVGNGWNIGFFSPHNYSDYNLLGGARLPHPFHLGKAAGDLDWAAWQKNYREPEKLDLAEWRKNSEFDKHSSTMNITADFNFDEKWYQLTEGTLIQRSGPDIGKEIDVSKFLSGPVKLVVI